MTAVYQEFRDDLLLDVATSRIYALIDLTPWKLGIFALVSQQKVFAYASSSIIHGTSYFLFHAKE